MVIVLSGITESNLAGLFALLLRSVSTLVSPVGCTVHPGIRCDCAADFPAVGGLSVEFPVWVLAFPEILFVAYSPRTDIFVRIALVVNSPVDAGRCFAVCVLGCEIVLPGVTVVVAAHRDGVAVVGGAVSVVC